MCGCVVCTLVCVSCVFVCLFLFLLMTVLCMFILPKRVCLFCCVCFNVSCGLGVVKLWSCCLLLMSVCHCVCVSFVCLMVCVLLCVCRFACYVLRYVVVGL